LSVRDNWIYLKGIFESYLNFKIFFSTATLNQNLFCSENKAKYFLQQSFTGRLMEPQTAILAKCVSKVVVQPHHCFCCSIGIEAHHIYYKKKQLYPANSKVIIV